MDAVSEVNDRYRLIGAPASPFSIKMRALMRYRRIPFDWVLRTDSVARELAHFKRPLMPTLQLPDSGEYLVDSTPLVHLLEERHPEMRSVIPPDPAQRFLNALLEDFADEWAPKFVFHYRWHAQEDHAWAERWVVGPTSEPITAGGLDERAQAFGERQRGQSFVAGATAENAPVLENSFERVTQTFEALFDCDTFLFGARPSSADFAWYGQLMECFLCGHAGQIMRGRTPRLSYWLFMLEDASGWDGDWRPAEKKLSPPMRQLLTLAGDVYFPYLLATETALNAGRDDVTADLPGGPYRQGISKYHVKCLNALRREFAGLDRPVRQELEPLLEATGCLRPLLDA